jgi:hypothetical protein
VLGVHVVLAPAVAAVDLEQRRAADESRQGDEALGIHAARILPHAPRGLVAPLPVATRRVDARTDILVGSAHG